MRFYILLSNFPLYGTLFCHYHHFSSLPIYSWIACHLLTCNYNKDHIQSMSIKNNITFIILDSDLQIITIKVYTQSFTSYCSVL